MIPEFITADFIAECRKARHAQGWWGSIVAPITTGYEVGTSSGVPPWPTWALPPVGTGPQSNVRVGDLAINPGEAWGRRGAPVQVVTWVDEVPGSGLRVRTNRVMDSTGTLPLSALAPLVFLPRLDQLLWMAEAGRTYHGAYLQVAFPLLGTISPVATLPLLSDAREVDWRGVAIDMILHADQRLKALGCPAREV